MTLAEVAKLVDGEVRGDAVEVEITRMEALGIAEPGAIAPVIGKMGIRRAPKSRASALLVDETLAEYVGDRPRVVVEDVGAARRVLEEHFSERAQG